MANLLTLLRLGFSTTLLDVDNALYMTSAVDPLPQEVQRRAIFWGLVIEFFARLGLVVIFGFIASGTEVLFEVFGIAFTPETISLLLAGSFLLVRSSRDLVSFFGDGEEVEPENKEVQDKSFARILLEMSVVNILLSVDTVIALTGSALAGGLDFGVVLILLLFSAVIRLFFIGEIARIIKKYPAINIVVLVFLILIGVELIAQGLGVTVPERLFNGLLLLALVAAIAYQRWGVKTGIGNQ